MIRAITVCVDYWDFLSITLPLNRKHFAEVLVVTSSKDINTQDLCKELNVPFFVTDSFYSHGAMFNKWLALEEGLDHFGREGWLCIMDADILWPETISMPPLEIGKLYGPRRRMSPHLLPESQWKSCPIWNNGDFSGYTQIFSGDDPLLLNRHPWHELNWTHAGGADTFFQAKWEKENKIRLDWEVLHIGAAGTNWCGRVAPIDNQRPPEAFERLAQLRKFMALRKYNPDKNYTPEKLQ